MGETKKCTKQPLRDHALHDTDYTGYRVFGKDTPVTRKFIFFSLQLWLCVCRPVGTYLQSYAPVFLSTAKMIGINSEGGEKVVFTMKNRHNHFVNYYSVIVHR